MASRHDGQMRFFDFEMQSIHINLRQLRHFVALVEHRSFIAAAMAVNLSQSAFSRSIQMLETTAGSPLVDRAGKNLPLTAKGQIVFRRAQRLLAEASQLSDEIVSGANGRENRLQFACGPAPAAHVVPHALARFIRQAPGVRVDFDVRHLLEEMEQSLQAREIEFFVADSRPFDADPAYRTVRLRQHRWRFCCRVGHPLARERLISLQQLLRFPLASAYRPPALARGLADITGRADFKPTVICENAYVLQQLILNSDAIGITLDCNTDIASGRAKALVLANMDRLDETKTYYGFVSLAGQTLSSNAQRYLDCLQAVDQQDSMASHRLLLNALAV